MLGQLPPLPKYRTDRVTRHLCATAHLDAAFAREILEEYAEDGINAVGLPLGINLVAAVRHARQAEERVGERDRVLAALLGALLALAALGATALAQDMPGLATVLLVAAMVPLPAAGWVVFRAEWAARTAAVEVMTGSAPAQQLAPPVDPVVEQQLETLKRANMVAYHEKVEAQNPFVGSGWRITESVWAPIDVSRPAKDPSGRPLVPKSFTAADLHHHLAVEMSKITGLGALKARNRLYVRGLHVASLGAEVLPDPTRRPLQVIPSRLVKAGAVHSGGGMETYLCLRMLGEGGRVVVTMHLRAQLLLPRLAWEVNAYVLPPLGHRFSLPARLSCTRSELRLRTAVDSARWTRKALTGSAGRLWRRRSSQAARARSLERVRREIRKQYGDYDYGSVNSLRERAADWGRMGFAERRDAALYFKLMVQAVLEATESFLTAHHIDTSDLRTQQQQIISHQTYNFNGVINGPVQAGQQNQMANQFGPPPGGNQPVPPPGGGQAAAGPPLPGGQGHP